MKRRALLVLAAAVASAIGCERQATGPAAPQEASLSINANLTGTAITGVVVDVTGPGIPDTLVFNLTVSSGQASGTIQVPTGSGRVLTVHGFDTKGIETHRGTSTIDVQLGTNPGVTVTLLPLTGDQPIVVTVGTIFVSVTPVAATLSAGDTLRFRAVVTDSTGDTLNVRVGWASTSPSIVAVDTMGLASAKAAGAAQVVAVFGTAAGSAGVTVPLSWMVDTVLGGGALGEVWGSGPNNVFALGLPGQIAHFDGTSWSLASSGTADGLGGLWGVSATSVYATGGNFAGTTDVVHYDGSSWAKITAPVAQFLSGIWGRSDTSLFVVATDGSIFHYNGTTWSAMGSPTTGRFEDVWGASDSAVFAVGRGGLIARYDGSSWQLATSGTTADLSKVWGLSATDVFASGTGGVMLHFDGTSWSTSTTGTTQALQQVWGTSQDNIVVVGPGGTIVHFDGNSWSPMQSGTTIDLSGVWAGSATEFIVTGANGMILRSY
jgi:hypothetical protein